MRKIEVWVEGYAATGERGGCWFAGVAEANTLHEAAEKVAKENRDFRNSYDPVKHTWWGCRIFESRCEAQKSFG
jgi:hypothetical protein